MRASYRNMLIEHEAIELAAQMLLDDLKAGHVSDTELSHKLGLLRGIIDHHLVAEERVFSQLSAEDLSGPWVAAWREGANAFERLKSDWKRFLQKWGELDIAADRDGFCADAAPILERLKERVQLETKVFYAVALQTGAISLL
jgi:hypothetical protein